MAEQCEALRKALHDIQLDWHSLKHWRYKAKDCPLGHCGRIRLLLEEKPNG